MTAPLVDRTSGYSGHLFDPYVASKTEGNVKRSSFVLSAASFGQAKTLDMAKRFDRILASIEKAHQTAIETSAYAAILALESFGLELPTPDLVYQLSYTLSDSGDLAIDIGHGAPADGWRHGERVAAS